MNIQILSSAHLFGHRLINGMLILAFACVAIVSASAQVIVDFNPPITALSATPANVTATGANVNANLVDTVILSRGPGIDPFNGASRFNATNWGVTTLQAALDGNKYFTFTVTPDAGYTINLESLNVKFQTSSVNSPHSFGLFSSLTGFSAASEAIGGGNYGSGTNVISSLMIVDLSGSTFQNVASPIEFRIYAYGSSDLPALNLSLNQLQLEGSVVVPEPTTAMLCLASGAIAFLRRRKFHFNANQLSYYLQLRVPIRVP